MTRFSLAFCMLSCLGFTALSEASGTRLLPANRAQSGNLSLRNISLGEPQFANPALYNLYDQGGSPMGLLETNSERLHLSAGFLNSGRTAENDSLVVDHSDFTIPQFGFFQPGVFGAVLYFQKESEAYSRLKGDSVETSKTRFGLDLAAGPSSGLFRIGFGVHAVIGNIDYPGEPQRVLLEIPSLRLDIGSRLAKGVELTVFTGMSGHFDSLESPIDRHERVATMTLPRYGILVDIGGVEGLPLMGNTSLEFGDDRFFGEYRQVGQGGVEYPIIWTGYYAFQTQWLYSINIKEFLLQPACFLSLGGENAQGYQGIQGNQNPLRKGDKIAVLNWKTGTTNFGLAGNASFREMVSVLMEWETSGRRLEKDSTLKQQYYRFSSGTEVKLEKIAALHFPKSLSLALRLGRTWRQAEKNQPGYRSFHFETFLPAPQVATRTGMSNPSIDFPRAYSAYHAGFGLSLLERRIEIDGLLSFPNQLEAFTPTRTKAIEGTEIALTATYRIF
jgi:hypothetical protein